MSWRATTRHAYDSHVAIGESTGIGDAPARRAARRILVRRIRVSEPRAEIDKHADRLSLCVASPLQVSNSCRIFNMQRFVYTYRIPFSTVEHSSTSCVRLHGGRHGIHHQQNQGFQLLSGTKINNELLVIVHESVSRPPPCRGSTLVGVVQVRSNQTAALYTEHSEIQKATKLRIKSTFSDFKLSMSLHTLLSV